MGDVVDRPTKPVRRAVACASAAETIGKLTFGVNHYNLPVDVPPGCLLASTHELEYYPSAKARNEGGLGRTSRHSGYYWHVPVGPYRKGDQELHLVLVVSVYAQLTEEEGLIHADLIREALGIQKPAERVN